MADGKSKKHGRYKIRCAAYKSNQRAEFNKARRLKKHLRKHPMNQTGAWAALDKLSGNLYSAHRAKLGLAEFTKGRQ
jgi:hypothetical protein